MARAEFPGAGLADLVPWEDWESAADDALRFLHQHVGWDAWVVTQVEGERQVIVRARPEEEVAPGTVLPWEGSLCQHMLLGEGPRVATVTAAVPAYATCRDSLGTDAAAYMGAPILTRDRRLFGAVCGLAHRARPRSAARELPVVETVARMLGTLLPEGAGEGAPVVPG